MYSLYIVGIVLFREMDAEETADHLIQLVIKWIFLLTFIAKEPLKKKERGGGGLWRK